MDLSNGSEALPEGVNAGRVETPRLAAHLLEGGPESGVPILFAHGNASSPRFFDDSLAMLPDREADDIPDCGHSPHVEKPGEFRRLLLDFLEARARTEVRLDR